METKKDVTYKDDVATIHTDAGLQKLLKEHECETIEKLDDLLWYTYGIQLVDARKK